MRIGSRKARTVRASGAWLRLGLAVCVAMSAGVASAAEEKKTEDGWTGEVAASITAQSGTVDTFAGALDAVGKRDWERDVATLRFSGVYGISRDAQANPSQDETLQDAQGLFGTWKRTFNDRFFWDSRSEVSRDSTVDREVRAAFSTGPGFRVWRRDDAKKHHFDVSAGLGYRYELYDGNTGPAPNGSFVARNGSDQHLADALLGFEYKNLFFGDRVDWTHTGSIAMPVNQTESWVARSEAIAGIPLSEAWSFRTSVLYEYVNNVPDGINPSTLRTTVGLGYQF